MKAKEIIRLYEDEEKLSSDEIAKLINNYFIKKCKSIGMEMDFSTRNKSLFAALTVASSVSFSVSQEQKYFKRYLKKVSDILKKNNIDVTIHPTQLHIYLFPAISSVWINSYIFSIYVHLDNHNVVVEIHKSYVMCVVEQKHELANYEEFSSELGLSEVYRLIDAMVKAIRLTPLEIEAGNES